MTFSLIITTYNRPSEILSLVRQALDCSPTPELVIVVDSSDESHTQLPGMQGVCYIRSSHKNQPYQRLLGANAATSDIVIFLDDDLIITRMDIFELILEAFQKHGIVGSAVAFQYGDKTNAQIPDEFNQQENLFLKWFWQFTGVPFPTEGKAAQLGVVGKKPAQAGYTETFNGANMAFYRAIFLAQIPSELLSLYECKLGKGEDKIISLKICKKGNLFFNPTICLQHPDNESTYFQNTRSFNAKVTYSRLYLSRIYAEVFEKNWGKEMLIFHWFTLWRLVIAAFSLLLLPSEARRLKFLGILDGWWLALKLPQKAEKLTPGINWKKEIRKDLERSGNQK